MAAPKQGSMSGADVLPKYNWGLGMNDEMMESDRGGFVTSVEMVTGGQAFDWYCFGGLEVGNPYDMDPMGEVRDNQTFSGGDGPQALGSIGGASTGSAGSQDGGGVVDMGGGKTARQAPQTYTKFSNRSEK